MPALSSVRIIHNGDTVTQLVVHVNIAILRIIAIIIQMMIAGTLIIHIS